LPDLAFNFDPATMNLGDVLADLQTQLCTSLSPRTSLVHSIETLKDVRYMLLRDADA
jgi:hypothetical protein